MSASRIERKVSCQKQSSTPSHQKVPRQVTELPLSWDPDQVKDKVGTYYYSMRSRPDSILGSTCKQVESSEFRRHFIPESTPPKLLAEHWTLVFYRILPFLIINRFWPHEKSNSKNNYNVVSERLRLPNRITFHRKRFPSRSTTYVGQYWPGHSCTGTSFEKRLASPKEPKTRRSSGKGSCIMLQP